MTAGLELSMFSRHFDRREKSRSVLVGVVAGDFSLCSK